TYHTPYVILENLHLERTIQDGVFYWFATGEVRNCIFRNEDKGIYVQELAYRGPDVIIENNLFYYNGQAIELYAWSHAKILNNHFVGTGYLQNTGTGLSSVIKNNLFITEINTYGNAILEFDNATIENNTIINGWYGIEVTKNCRVRNNIFHNQIYHALNFRNYTGGSYDISYNMYTDSNRVSTDTTRYRADSTDVFCADPMFVNNPYQYWFIGPPPGGYDYHLEAYSPAIDRGDPMILDKDG
ncbi:MAG: right-handed parallel beta-helix repeat-containing protein, partial [Ignavibacteriaceae bacterium]|nr:right-handed parallel beta-helix repeat-containing protein [Ignavibacteriaceae bacterium]